MSCLLYIALCLIQSEGLLFGFCCQNMNLVFLAVLRHADLFLEPYRAARQDVFIDRQVFASDRRICFGEIIDLDLKVLGFGYWRFILDSPRKLLLLPLQLVELRFQCPGVKFLENKAFLLALPRIFSFS
jgi:hypothetical protein